MYVRLWLLVAAAAAASAGDGCDKLVSYTLVLHTYWTRDNFPKHYPEWRPPAQWSRLYGVSHAPSHVLFRLGRRVSGPVREFVETGRSDSLLDTAAGRVMDVFLASPIPQGAGRTEASFFLDGNHSRVSAMVRMVPSPDWFVGVDSFDLCVDGNWLDTITIEADPLDAGTDNGFTFTAPNWPTSPQGVAYRVTSRYPAHPAGSFYYPHLRRLPPIATFQFIKTREYELSNVFQHQREQGYEVLQLEKNSIDLLDGNRALEIGEAQERLEEAAFEKRRSTPTDNTYYTLWNGPPSPVPVAPSRASPSQRVPIVPEWGPSTPERSPSAPTATNASVREGPHVHQSPDTGSMLHSLARKVRARRRRRKHPPASRRLDCRVSAWSAWSPCDGACGVGESARKRRVERRARRGGKRCPPLVQTRWCIPDGCAEPHVMGN